MYFLDGNRLIETRDRSARLIESRWRANDFRHRRVILDRTERIVEAASLKLNERKRNFLPIFSRERKLFLRNFSLLQTKKLMLIWKYIYIRDSFKFFFLDFYIFRNSNFEVLFYQESKFFKPHTQSILTIFILLFQQVKSIKMN